MDVALILAIFEKILIYGPRAVLSIADAMRGEEDFTVDQLKRLEITKDPEDYFGVWTDKNYVPPDKET